MKRRFEAAILHVTRGRGMIPPPGWFVIGVGSKNFFFAKLVR